jgi:hypothetical protein
MAAKAGGKLSMSPGYSVCDTSKSMDDALLGTEGKFGLPLHAETHLQHHLLVWRYRPWDRAGKWKSGPSKAPAETAVHRFRSQSRLKPENLPNELSGK